MIIFVKNYGNGKTITLNVESTDTIESVREKIDEIVDIPPELQKLLFGGKQLEDGRILADYCIQEMTCLNLLLNIRGVYELYIKTPTGKIITIYGAGRDTIKKIKGFIQHNEGIPIEQQKLTLHGVELEDEKTLAGYKLKRVGEQTLILKLVEENKQFNKCS